MKKVFDFIAYFFGYSKGVADGKQNVTLSGDAYTFTDSGNGNIVIAASN